MLSLQIPPLEERREDIPLLLEKMKEELHAGYTLAPDAMELIQNIHFEGNIRELRNLAERLNYSDQQYRCGELKRYLDQDVYGDEGREPTGDGTSGAVFVGKFRTAGSDPPCPVCY